MPLCHFSKERKDFSPQKFPSLIYPMETYLQVQEVYFTSWLTIQLFQSFGFYLHQIKQPFAIADFFWPLDIQSGCAKVFKRFTQVNYLLENNIYLSVILSI